MSESLFTSILQIGIVVDDLDFYMKKYHDEYGIGPWEVHLYTEKNLKDMTVRGEKVNYSMKAAFCQYFNVQLELIEPLDDQTIYSEFLQKNGPGFHHIAFDTKNHDDVVRKLEVKGNEKLQSGDYNGKGFTYLNTEKDLGFILEIYRSPKDWLKPNPISFYPPLKNH